MTSPKMPGGMGRFLWAQGTCETTGILTGEKYSSRKCPFSASVQARPSSLSLSTWWSRVTSSGQRKPPALRASSSRRSCVRRVPGTKVGGCVGCGGSESKGSTGIFRVVRKSSGSDAGVGWTFLATFLYARARVVGAETGEYDTSVVTGFQGRKPRPCGLAMDWSKFGEPARALGKRTENAVRAWRIRLGLYALGFACRYAWESLGAVEVARAIR